MDIELVEQYYLFAVDELPRVRQALDALQPTGLEWLDSLLRGLVVSTIERFEDAIKDYENIRGIVESYKEDLCE